MDDFVLVGKKIMVGIAVAVVPLAVLISALWLTRQAL